VTRQRIAPVALAVGIALVPATVPAQAAAPVGPVTIIYFVRHAQVDPTEPTFPLNALGKTQAEIFARTVRGVQFTHVFSSHTTRARQMVEPVARDRNLPIRQLPQPGSRLDTVTVSDRTTSRAAIAPLLGALRELPAGSSALVGVNSDNIYALLNGMGVPVATAAHPCTPGGTCVSCLTNACFPGGEDQLWILVAPPGSAPRLIELRYGVTER
jgi:phosphohistidine phosphatase SixA